MFGGHSKTTSKSKKFSNDATEIPTSPKFSPKNDPQFSIKITQNDVTKSLKSMQLKRSSRLGTSAYDQSEIFEEMKKVDEHDEIEEVASTIRRLGGDRTKPTFKGIVEELLGSRADQASQSEPRKTDMVTPAINKAVPKNKASIPKKFINKFNCVINPNDVSSGEGNIELDDDTYLKHVSLPDGVTNASHQYNQNIVNKSVYSDISQRKTIYFKDDEAALPDLISTASSGANTVITGQFNSKETAVVENDHSKLDEASTNSQEVSDDRKVIILRQKFEIKASISRNSSDPLKPHQCPPLSSRRTSREDRIVKKLQRSCKSLDEILKSDADVDLDEIDDLKITLDEADSLVKEYRAKLHKLEETVSPSVSLKKRLCEVKVQLNKLKDDVEKFNSLKRDSQYMQLCSRLSNFHLEVHNIANKFELGSVKRELLAEVDKCIKKLEAKASRNERFLIEILSDQVECIGNKYFGTVDIS